MMMIPLRLLTLVIATTLLGASHSARAQLPPPVPRDPPSNCAAPEHRQLDFWIGDWDVYRTGTQELAGRSKVESAYHGCAIREEWRPFDLLDGGSLSSYDRAAKIWRQTWVDATGSRLEYSGQFLSDRLVLTGMRKNRTGAAETIRVTQYPQGSSVRQIGETSPDGGRRWSPWYDYTYREHRAPIKIPL